MMRELMISLSARRMGLLTFNLIIFPSLVLRTSLHANVINQESLDTNVINLIMQFFACCPAVEHRLCQRRRFLKFSGPRTWESFTHACIWHQEIHDIVILVKFQIFSEPFPERQSFKWSSPDSSWIYSLPSLGVNDLMICKSLPGSKETVKLGVLYHHAVHYCSAVLYKYKPAWLVERKQGMGRKIFIGLSSLCQDFLLWSIA